MKHDPETWLRHKRRLLGAWCADGRRTYYRWEPEGMEATVTYPGGYQVEVKVAAVWDGGERPSLESPGERGGWEILAVWYQRRGTWVDLSPVLSVEQSHEVGRQLDQF